MRGAASLVRSLAAGIVAWLAIQTLLFCLIQAAPGGPAAALAGDFSTAETQAAVVRSFDLDQPVLLRYRAFVVRMAQGDWGQSYKFRRSVGELIAERLAPTLVLMLSALLIAAAIGSAFGIWAATLKHGAAASAAAAAAAHALPVFWVGQLLALGLGFELRWFPLSGLSDPRGAAEGWRAWLDIGWHAVLPVATLALQQAAFFATVVLGKARLELSLGYVRALRARGIAERVIVWGHVGRNVAPQIVIAIFNRVGMLFTGAVLVETLFAWPGLGRLLGSAILNRDHPVLLGIFALVTAAVIVSNGLADLLHARLDPRIGLDRELR